MRLRIYTFLSLFFALVMINGKQAKAYNSENPNGHFVTASANHVPVNYIFTSVVLGIVLIGMMVIRNANKAINTKLKTQRYQRY